MEIITSQRGKKMVMCDDYLFYLKRCRKDNSSSVWVCAKKYNGCRANLRLNDKNEILSRTGEHTHDPESGKLSKLNVKSKMWEIADQLKDKMLTGTGEQATLRQLYKQSVSKMSIDEKTLPTFDSVKYCFYRMRKKSQNTAQPSESCSSGTNLSDSESSENILPDIEPETESYLDCHKIDIKKEIIEIEPDISSYDDESLASLGPPSSESSSSFKDSSLTICPPWPSTSYHDSPKDPEPSTSYHDSPLTHVPVTSFDDSPMVAATKLSCHDSLMDPELPTSYHNSQMVDAPTTSCNDSPIISGPPTFHHKLPSNKTLHSTVETEQRRDKFDVYGEFIASKMRHLDPRSCAFIQTAVADLIFEAELGRYLSDREKSIFNARTNELLKCVPPPTSKEESEVPPVIDSSVNSSQPDTLQPDVTRSESLNSSASTVPLSRTHDNATALTDTVDDWNKCKGRLFRSDPKRPAVGKVFCKKNDRFDSTDFPSPNVETKLPKDKFDIYEDFISCKLRDLDTRSCAFVRTAIADLIFEAELGRFLSDGERSIFNSRTSEFLKSMPSPCPKTCLAVDDQKCV